ncbi:exosortase-associated protein EpsI, B-type [Aquincola sp. J276]|uniref:exosortase-associated protein EpsI, B-type n=1 Tax=Aquincola sp. J276 TaxID=2898432 RepID=UPI002151583E|nr:exosortase-associated protein EpsI, B-type [Aquincola sp. J276]MCR5866786.1 EpsI family protein [Aquincola sp. J276]
MNLTRRSLVMSGLMIGGAATAELIRPKRHLSDVMGLPKLPALFPREIAAGVWSVDELTPAVITPPNVQAVLDSLYNEVLTRTYVRAGRDRVMLSVAYGGDQSDATKAHRPEVCYPAQGFQISGDTTARIALAQRELPVRNLLAKLGPRSEPITYWMVTGEHAVVSGTQQKLAQMRYGLKGWIPDGMLVRISTISSDYSVGLRLNEEFIRSLYGELSGDARARVFGRAG